MKIRMEWSEEVECNEYYRGPVQLFAMVEGPGYTKMFPHLIGTLLHANGCDWYAVISVYGQRVRLVGPGRRAVITAILSQAYKDYKQELLMVNRGLTKKQEAYLARRRELLNGAD